MQTTIRHRLADPRAHDRVRRHTASHVNDKIDRLTELSIQECVAAGREAIIARLVELDREWDIDRALMVNFSLAGALTSELGQRYPAWRYLFRAQLAFLFVHAVVGWCPPVSLLRRLGFRTAKEISVERTVLLQRLNAQAATPPIPPAS